MSGEIDERGNALGDTAAFPNRLIECNNVTFHLIIRSTRPWARYGIDYALDSWAYWRGQSCPHRIKVMRSPLPRKEMKALAAVLDRIDPESILIEKWPNATFVSVRINGRWIKPDSAFQRYSSGKEKPNHPVPAIVYAAIPVIDYATGYVEGLDLLEWQPRSDLAERGTVPIVAQWTRD